MNIDEALRGLGETLSESTVDVEAGRQRLRAAVRRLHDDPLEAQRIDNLAKLVDRYEKDCRLGREALHKQDYGTAGRYLRRAAQHGNDEAAYWLGLLLEMRSLQQRLKGRPDKAGKLAAEAREWRRRARESGIAEALDETLASDTPPPPGPAQPKVSRRDHGQDDERARKDATAPPVQRASAPRGDCYAVGIELLPYRFTVVLTNDHGEVISEEVRDVTDMAPGAAVGALSGAAREIVASTLGQGFPADRVALGVQLGGPVDTETGTVNYLCKYPPRASCKAPFKWENFPLGSRLRQETGFPVVILNDTVALAEREQWYGVGQETGDFVVMLIREGVGGAVVSNGQHFKGPVEVGQFITYPAALSQGDAETFGALESAAGGTAIAAAAGEATGRTINDLQTAIDVANEDGPGRKAAAAFKSAGVAASAGLGYLVQFAGPSHVVLYAPEGLVRTGGHAADVFLGQVMKFKSAVAFEVYRNCELVLRPIGINDGAHGVALAALRRCFQLEPTTSSIGAGSVR